ncbi:MAG TPA: 2-oxoglutarate dehydrogenase, E2 component, dihydrolipoamide succinyltransferase, partial [Candidatus Avipropionibacterium avicola]|nr:2-oxoglutarate dehydrogenase, E2 component, dihydrolipoamide succinyltransferase [Candidatus Avipropionibacterium avicola]
MATEVTLPALGESVTEGTVSRWLKQVGDTIEADEALLEVSTDKVDTEIPSPAAGTLLEIKVEEDETVEVGTVLAVIGEAGEGGGDNASAESEHPAEEPAQEAEAPAAESAPEPAEEPAPQQEPASAPAASGAASGTEITLPALGESVTEGTVSRWLKQVGDSVETDEALLEVSTDKVDTEVPSPVAGTLLEIRVEEDETVEVGTVLAVIGDGSAPAAEDTSDQSAPESAAEPEPEPQPEPEKKPEPEPEPEKKPEPAAKAEPAQAPAARRAATSGDEPYVTPLVRKIAQQQGVDLAQVKGTGVGGRIRKQDILEAAEAAKKAAAAPAAATPSAPAAASAVPTPSPEAAALRGTTEKVSRIRKTIATRMVDSLQTAAQLTATVEVDLTRISQLRNKVKAEFQRTEGAKLTHLAFITKAAVESLKAFPKVNAQIDTEAGEITYADTENIGLAVDTEKGLMVPVIKDAGDLNLAGIAKKIGDLGNRSRNGGLTPDDLSGGTFTITNYGSAGTLFDTPIINQPQVAILGTGAL